MVLLTKLFDKTKGITITVKGPKGVVQPIYGSLGAGFAAL